MVEWLSNIGEMRDKKINLGIIYDLCVCISNEWAFVLPITFKITKYG